MATRKKRITVTGQLPGGFTLQLGDSPVCTPGGRPLVLATRALAEAVALEHEDGFVLDDVTLYSVACSQTDFVQPPHGKGTEIRKEMARVHIPREVNTVMHLHPPELAPLGQWIRAWEALAGESPELELPPYGQPLVVESAFPAEVLARVERTLTEAPDAVITAMLNGLNNGLSCTAPYALHADPDDAVFFAACMGWAESPAWESTDGAIGRAEILAAWVRGGGTWRRRS